MTMILMLRTAAESVAAVSRLAAAFLLGLCVTSTPSLAAGFPQAEISNGQITARMYLPDPTNGFYRSTRFDWSGAIYSLQFKGHDFYGMWFDRVDPKVINWVHQGPEIVCGPCGALAGPVDEFETVLGWNATNSSGTFIKIGVGVLRKTEGNYNRYFPYDVLNSGKWSLKKESDSFEFTQELTDTNSGYAYVYRKVVRLAKGKPEMEIDHSLKNTGRLAIKSTVYNHNFVVLDKQPPGPDFIIRLPFQIQTGRQPNRGHAEVRGNQVVFPRPLAGEDEAVVFITGFGDSAKDTEIVIENKKVGAGLKMTGDRPLTRDLLWSIRTVLAIEPYIAIDIQPGAEFTWKNTFEYYTMPAGKQQTDVSVSRWAGARLRQPRAAATNRAQARLVSAYLADTSTRRY